MKQLYLFFEGRLRQPLDFPRCLKLAAGAFVVFAENAAKTPLVRLFYFVTQFGHGPF
jgi:hypothetical protein